MIITTLDGKEWDKKDLIKQMDSDEFYYGYLGENCLSSSAIKQMYKQGSWNYEPVKESPALRDGRLIHLMTLEPNRIKDYIFTGGTRASKLYKELLTKLSPELVYTVSEFNRCDNIASAVRLDFDAFDIMHNAEFEIPEIQMIEGLPVRGKADILGDGFIADLKTTSDISRTDEAVLHWSYDIQGALYCDLFGLDNFTIIWVDKKTLEVKVQEFTPQQLEEGREKYLESIKLYKK